MDYFGLTSYGKDDSSIMEDNCDIIVLNDTQEFCAVAEVKKKTSKSKKHEELGVVAEVQRKTSKGKEQEELGTVVEVKRKTSRRGKTEIHEEAKVEEPMKEPEAEPLIEHEHTEIEAVNVAAKLKELNSVVRSRKTKATAKKPVAPKGKKAGKTIVVNQPKTNTQSNQQALVPVPAPVGRRRSKRLQKSSADPVDERTVDVIDLISAPPLLLPGVVNLDSEDEDKMEAEKRAKDRKLDLLLDSENYEMSIKLKWNGKIEKHELKKYEPFEVLMKQLAEREKADFADIVLMQDTKIIKASDTPDSIDYKVTQFLTGRIISADSMGGATKKPKRDKNVIKIKIQAAGLKKPLNLDIDKTQRFTGILFQIATELKCDAEKLKLHFDGDLIDLNSTPNDLEFDGGEIIDCTVAN